MGKWLNAILAVLILVFPGFVAAQQSRNQDSQVPIFNWQDKAADIRAWLKKNGHLLDRGDGCSLLYYQFDRKSKMSTSLYSIAEFIIVPGDEEFTHIFRAPDDS